MSKTKVIDQNAESAVMKERLILSNIRSHYIVNMICSFQDTDSLYLVLELKSGGDLRYHLMNSQAFTESQVKFLLTNLIMGIEYIHSQDIIHRDIKPENILFDNKGYAFITDFNISCSKEEINQHKIVSGTPVYMAPETIYQNEQGFGVDYYSLGIIIHECIYGRRPYEGNSLNDVKQILKDFTFQIEKSEIASYPLQAIINGLLIKNPNERLGALSGASEIKESTFFQNFNWDYLQRRKYVSPIIDIIDFAKSKNETNELFDKTYCERSEEIDESTNERYYQIVNHQNYPNYFRQYTYLCKEAINDIMKKSEENIVAAPPKKTMSYSRSSENINLPRLKTGSQKSISISNDDYQIDKNSHHHHHHHHHKKYDASTKGSDSHALKDLYKYKYNKYKTLLKLKQSNDLAMVNQNPQYCYCPNCNCSNNYYPQPYQPFQQPNHRSNSIGNGNGKDIYKEVCNGIQKKLYMDIFGDSGLDKYNPRKRVFGMPNQYQINNYYPPQFMGMPNPYYYMMNPFPVDKKNNFFLPNIYGNGNDNDKNKHKHRHRHHDKSSYSKSSSSYISSKYKSSKKSEDSRTTKTKKKKKKSKSKSKSSEEDEESKTKKSKKSKKTKKSKKSEKSKKAKKKKKKDEEENEEDEENEDNEENEENEENEGEEKEDDEDGEEDSKKEGGEDEENEEGDGDGDEEKEEGDEEKEEGDEEKEEGDEEKEEGDDDDDEE